MGMGPPSGKEGQSVGDSGYVSSIKGWVDLLVALMRMELLSGAVTSQLRSAAPLPSGASGVRETQERGAGGLPYRS